MSQGQREYEYLQREFIKLDKWWMTLKVLLFELKSNTHLNAYEIWPIHSAANGDKECLPQVEMNCKQGVLSSLLSFWIKSKVSTEMEVPIQ